MRCLIPGLKGAVLGVSVLASALGPALRAQTPAPAAAPAPEVAIRFTAFDEQNNHMTALAPGDIKLTVGGKARAVTSLRQDGGPLSVVVALDASASQERVLGGAKLVADAFVQRVLRPGVDEAGVVTFTGEAALEQPPTGDVSRVREAIGRVRYTPPPGYVPGRLIAVPHGTPPPASPRAGSTAIWDAVAFVSEKVLAPRPGPARRALILISDGMDTSSRTKPGEAVRRALRGEVVVYAVGIGDDEQYGGVEEGALRKLAEQTGGLAFFPKRAEELPAVFARIQAALHSPLVLTFAAPGPQGGAPLREVKLEITNPELRRRRVKLSYPRGYFAR